MVEFIIDCSLPAKEIIDKKKVAETIRQVCLSELIFKTWKRPYLLTKEIGFEVYDPKPQKQALFIAIFGHFTYVLLLGDLHKKYQAV